MKTIILATVLLVLLLNPTSSVTIYENGEPGDFDFYLFVQQWIYSYCGEQTCIGSKVREAFTVHGLWPENTDGSYPSFCSGPTFSSSAISDLLTELDYDWPSLTGPNTDFWTHEWSKHGTCSITGPITNQHSYFQTGLSLYDKFNITQAFEQKDIYPSSYKTYSPDDMIDAIDSVYGGKPALQCQSGDLSTIAVCIDKDTLDIMDCPYLSGWTCSGDITWPSSDNNNSY
ncbi:ribonuclease T2 [Tieghemostelium lacteum]|uniref:Ribonuclease T2 n=1 Tax=Tieghemostelium lacteum TaxID=361077 RepID=A0A151Z7W3_TIELA|nr:ribonuclease T2 [Tieghemostelium lacteum]|eukprot:KYQ89874.1 ribonuclease T2 [Tieghemostelium lacteum]